MTGRIASFAMTLLFTVSLTPSFALADEEHPAIAYRQSLMTLVGHNFGPMAMTADGDIPWDDTRMGAWGKDLKALSGLNFERGFPPGSEKGNTEAKPNIWQNLDDFKEKLKTMQSEIAKLGDIAASGNRDAISQQIGVAGKTCKSCHDEYKEEHD